MSAVLLEFDRVSAGYDRATILEDLSLTVHEGESLALLGRNGVGKTTLISTIMGATVMRGGAVRWRGADLARVAPYRRAGLGIGWVAQERWIFPSLTVKENLLTTARGGAWTLDRIHQLFPRIQERQHNLGNQLSGGEQQMLAIARALMLDPRLLLLDEPLEGLAPVIVDELVSAITAMCATGDMTVILVEQHAHVALGLTKKAVVMDRGRIVFEGDSTSLLDDDARLERLIGLG
jgi:branched-chain amino acid transport system ATP-binding protein